MKRKAAELSQSLLTVADAFGVKIPSKRRRLRWARLGAKKRSSVNAKRLTSRITKDPFPRETRTTITWKSPLKYFAAGAISYVEQVALNGLYDPDYTNGLGNGQPQYFDQLLSATGPYQKYKVLGWKCKITIINVSPSEPDGSYVPLDCIIAQGVRNAVDIDTFDELEGSPGTMVDVIGPAMSTQGQKTFYINGKLTDYVPAERADDNDYSGSYNANPTKPLYLSIGLKNPYPSTTTNIKFLMKVQMECDVVFYERDGIVS